MVINDLNSIPFKMPWYPFEYFSISYPLKDVVRLGIKCDCRPSFRRLKAFRAEVDRPCENELDEISIIQLNRRIQYLQLCSDRLLGHQRPQSLHTV